MNKLITGRIAGMVCCAAAAVILALSGAGGGTITAHAEESASAAESGDAGTNTVWTYQDGVMTVSVDDYHELRYSGTNRARIGSSFYEDYLDTCIPEYAGSVKELVIGEGVRSIERYSFQEFTSLTKVTLPSTISYVGWGVLQDCASLDTIVYQGTLERWDSIQFGNSHVIIGSQLTSMKETLTPMVEYDLQTSGICGEDATWSYNNGVLTIKGNGHIDYLVDLYKDTTTEIVIEEGITEIASETFADYKNLTKVSLPASLSVLYNAFEGCDAITTVDYAGTDFQWTQIEGITYCTELLRVKPLNYGFEYTIDGDTLTITSISQPMDYEEGWKSPFTYDIKHIVIADGITSIGNNMFRDYYLDTARLESITLGADVERIGDNAFARKQLPDNSCTFTMGSKVTDIGDQAFYRCNIQEITLPATLRSVGDYAFSDRIPDSGETVGYSHYLLNKASYEGTDAQWDAIQFGEGNEELKMLTHGFISGKCGDNLYYSLDDDGLLVISGTGEMTAIPWRHFNYQKVIIESGCTSIFKNAFHQSGCVIYVPLTVKTIGYNAFLTEGWQGSGDKAYNYYLAEIGKGGSWASYVEPEIYYEGTIEWYEKDGAMYRGYEPWKDIVWLRNVDYQHGTTYSYALRYPDYYGYTYTDDYEIVEKSDGSTGGGTGESGTIEPGKNDGSNTGSDLDTGRSDTNIEDTTGRVEDQNKPDANNKGNNNGVSEDSDVDDTNHNDADEERTPHKDRDDDEDRHGTKYLSWVTVSAGTATTDGYMEYVCSECGRVKYRVPISAYYNFNKESETSIKNAAQGATVKVDTELFVSFHKSIVDELKARPDVTLIVDYTYQGVDYEMTIPAGSGALMEQLFGQDQFAGFRYLAGAFATVER